MTAITTRIALVFVMCIGVTNDTIEYGEIARCSMAIHALIPFIFMLSAVNREILLIVIPGRRLPGSGRVAIRASRWKLCRRVVWIVRSIVISLVTADTSFRRVVVISVVTGGTIRIDVRSGQ